MSLQVWLPLTDGTLKQQGLSSAMPSTDGTVTLTNAGKLGKCATLGTAAGRITLPASTMTSFTECSVAFWINIISWNTSYATFFQAGLSSTAWNNYIFGILRNNTNSNLCFTLTNSSASSTNASYTTSNLNIGQWYHLVFTYKSGTVSIYKDGVLDKTYSTTYVPNFAGITHVSIGKGTNNSSYQTNCDLNDFRIYDHCLSPMEVKELSQGLVLHYNLSSDSIQELNNCFNYPTFNTSSASGGWSHWGASGHAGTYGQTTDSNYIYRSGQAYAHWFANASTGTNYYILYQSPAFEGGYRSMSCIVKEENGGQITDAIINPSWNAPVSGTKPNNHWDEIIPLENDFYLCKIHGFQQTGSNDLVSLVIYPGTKIYVSEAYLENDKERCSDILFTNNIIYDNSGFCNNGEIYSYDSEGTITTTSNTPKYQVSTYINSSNNTTDAASGTRFIYGNCELITPQYLTVAFWCKPIAGYGNSTGQGQFSLTNNAIGSAGVDYLVGPMNHRDSIIDINNYNGSVHKTVSIVFTVNEWHHYVIVYDGRYARVYKDGIVGTTADMGSITALGSMKAAVIGFSRAGGVWRSNKSYYSDFRVYATALSAEDVLSLYQNSAYIDSSGNIYGTIHEV